MFLCDPSLCLDGKLLSEFKDLDEFFGGLLEVLRPNRVIRVQTCRPVQRWRLRKIRNVHHDLRGAHGQDAGECNAFGGGLERQPRMGSRP